jgi:hypothetical protein
LTDEEYAHLRDHADKAREIIASGKLRGYIATGGGRRIDMEQDAIDLFERVREIRQGAGSGQARA